MNAIYYMQCIKIFYLQAVEKQCNNKSNNLYKVTFSSLLLFIFLNEATLDI